MAFFDNLKEKAVDLAQAGVAKSKQLAEIAKLKTDNLAEEDAMKRAYIEIGKLYYAERGAAPEGAYVASCEKITAAKANIEANNAKIMEIKSESNISDAEEPVPESPDVPEPAAPAAEETPVEGDSAAEEPEE